MRMKRRPYYINFRVLPAERQMLQEITEDMGVKQSEVLLGWIVAQWLRRHPEAAPQWVDADAVAGIAKSE